MFECFSSLQHRQDVLVLAHQHCMCVWDSPVLSMEDEKTVSQLSATFTSSSPNAGCRCWTRSASTSAPSWGRLGPPGPAHPPLLLPPAPQSLLRMRNSDACLLASSRRATGAASALHVRLRTSETRLVLQERQRHRFDVSHFVRTPAVDVRDGTPGHLG